jgi:phosphoribosylformylglycinamidine cyclo-ligase
MAHITGGGFYDNIPRVIPEGYGVRVEKGSWPIPPIFRKIQREGDVDEREMFRTLNMGIGMALAVSAGDADRTIALFARLGHKAWTIGEIVRGKREVVLL